MRSVAMSELPGLVGEELGVSAWLTVTQERVNAFADATGDHQWIHVDVERATREMGAPIAHGFLTLSLIPHLGEEILEITGISRAINYGSNKVRFTNMVPVGSRVRLRQKLLSADSRGGGLQIVTECTIEVDGQPKPACIAEVVTIFFP